MQNIRKTIKRDLAPREWNDFGYVEEPSNFFEEDKVADQ